MTAARHIALTGPWRTSSRSTGGQECVEVAQAGADCPVRDSKNPHGTRLASAGGPGRRSPAASNTPLTAAEYATNEVPGTPQGRALPSG